MATLPRIGWIGLGRMGTYMAGFIVQAGYPLSVYARNPVNQAPLAALGARAASAVVDCVRDADIVFSCISDDAALRDIALGPAGVLDNLRAGGVFAETSTVSVDVSKEIDQAASARGVSYLRLPISGNAASARTGQITVLASGPPDAWAMVQPVCASFSKAQVYLGAGEQARMMKLVVNSMVVTMSQGMAEALALGRKAGLDWDVMLDTLASSTIASPWLKAKVELMKPRDFRPTMTARLILKDMDLMLAAARLHEVPMPLTAMTRQMVQALVGEGLGEEDYMALIKLAERHAGIALDD